MLRATVVLSILAAASAANMQARGYYEDIFKTWLVEHKVAIASAERFLQMLSNFADNDDIITRHNSGNATFTLGHNRFSHLSLSEWKEQVKLGAMSRRRTLRGTSLHATPTDDKDLPTEVDWVAAGAVTAVKDQGQCGSCWAFSSTGALEGAYFKSKGTLKSFSEQHLVDCDTVDEGCNGGLMDTAFDWVTKNGGICSEADYPYTSGASKKSGTCNTKCAKDADVAPKGYVDVAATDAALMSALAKQPVSIAIQADQSAFQLYKSGVFTAPCGTELDHGVLAVGYGEMNGVKHYKVKNSWGASWGQGGYIYLARGVAQPEGQCGLLTGPPSYPLL